MLYISECLNSPYGQTRAFLKKLVNEVVLVNNGYDNINGKIYKVYSVDKKQLFKVIKQNLFFRKMSAVIYEDYNDSLEGFKNWHKYRKEEIEEVKEMKK